MSSPWLRLAGIAVVSKDLKLRIIKEWPPEPAIDGCLGGLMASAMKSRVFAELQ